MTKENKFTRVVFQPHVYQGMQTGINQMANAVRPTLGPVPRNVAISKVKPHDQLPEMLDSGGVIARRIYQLPDRDVDTGAMFLRQLLWGQHELVGDGTATTAVLFQSVFNEALKFMAAGGNAMILRHHLEIGMRIIYEKLEEMVILVQNRETITQVAESVCFDPELSSVLGEILDITGVYGQVDIRSGRSRDITREYVGGTVYEGGFHTNLMVNDKENVRAQLENPAIFLSDLAFSSTEDVIPIVRAAAEAGLPGIVIVCRSISDAATGILYAASKNPDKFKALAVKTPGMKVSEQSAYLEDFGVLTGAKPYLQIFTDNAKNVNSSDLGRARRVWADKTFTSVIGGSGQPMEIRRHVAVLKGRYEHTDDLEIRKLTLTRLGKLMGGSATLYIGGLSEHDINSRKEVAGWAVGAIRSALLKGVLPGGGAALLACKPVMDEKAREAEILEEKVACQVLSRALEEPARTILSNAGYDPNVHIAKICDMNMGYGFDVRNGEISDMVEVGVIDSAGVVLEAVRGAISSAALGLTVDTIVHRKRQKIANNP